MDWATLFDRASEHETTVADVQAALAAVREGEGESKAEGETHTENEGRS